MIECSIKIILVLAREVAKDLLTSSSITKPSASRTFESKLVKAMEAGWKGVALETWGGWLDGFHMLKVPV